MEEIALVFANNNAAGDLQQQVVSNDQSDAVASTTKAAERGDVAFGPESAFNVAAALSNLLKQSRTNRLNLPCTGTQYHIILSHTGSSHGSSQSYERPWTGSHLLAHNSIL